MITGDALFAQEMLCHKICQCKGNYVFKAKKNKKRIVDDIDQNLYLNRNTTLDKFETITKEHGRIEHRVRDSIFKEDVANIASRRSQQNCAALRKFSIFLLSKITSSITNAIRLVTSKISLAFKMMAIRT